MTSLPKRTTKKLRLLDFTLDPSKLGPKAQKLFSRGICAGDLGSCTEESAEKMHEALDEGDREFLRPKTNTP